MQYSKCIYVVNHTYSLVLSCCEECDKYVSVDEEVSSVYSCD